MVMVHKRSVRPAPLVSPFVAPFVFGASRYLKMRSAALVSLALLLPLVFPLAGCLSNTEVQDTPLYSNLNRPYQAVDSQEALALVNTYRKKNGLGLLSLDARLTAAAQAQASAMAETGKVSHALTPNQALPKRLARNNYDYARAVENIGAGYWSLAEAFSGWRDSREHNKNMLNRDVTQMGIATHYNPDVKYKVYWSLILAKPDALTEVELKVKPKSDAAAYPKKTDSLADLFGR